MKELNISRKQIITLVITLVLLIGIGVGVYLVQIQHVFQSKASAMPLDFVKTDTGAGVDCQQSVGETNCTTDAQKVEIKINTDYFEELSK